MSAAADVGPGGATLGPVLVTEDELRAWGRAVGARTRVPAFFALSGPLGAGKSVFARALARGAGVRGAVPSPTYNLVLAYEPSPDRRVIHMDLYRLSAADEIFELGWDDWLADPDALLAVEWAERAEGHLPDHRWDLRLSTVPDRPELRRLEGRAVGSPPALPELLTRAAADVS